jgi:hypothetical protein
MFSGSQAVWFPIGGQGTVVGSRFTYTQQETVLAPAVGFYIVLRNLSSSAANVNGCKIAPAAVAGDNGTGSGWQTTQPSWRTLQHQGNGYHRCWPMMVDRTGIQTKPEMSPWEAGRLMPY